MLKKRPSPDCPRASASFDCRRPILQVARSRGRQWAPHHPRHLRRPSPLPRIRPRRSGLTSPLRARMHAGYLVFARRPGVARSGTIPRISLRTARRNTGTEPSQRRWASRLLAPRHCPGRRALPPRQRHIAGMCTQVVHRSGIRQGQLRFSTRTTKSTGK